MTTTQTSGAYASTEGAEELARQIAEMYREVANETGRVMHFPTGSPIAEALGYTGEEASR